MDILTSYCLLGWTSLKQGPPLPSLSRNTSLALQIDMRLSPTPSLEPGPPLQLLGEPYRKQPLGPDSTQIFKVSLCTLVRSVPLGLGAPFKTNEGLGCG